MKKRFVVISFHILLIIALSGCNEIQDVLKEEISKTEIESTSLEEGGIEGESINSNDALKTDVSNIVSTTNIDEVEAFVSARIYPNFETVGVIIKLSDAYLDESIVLDYKSDGNFKRGHDFVKYDGNHIATSLFDLEQDTEYIIKVTVLNQDAQDEIIDSYTTSIITKKDYQIPNALNTISVRNQSELEQAVYNAKAGDEIVLETNGNYKGFEIEGKNGQLDHPIVIRSIGEQQALINGKIIISLSQNIVFDNIEVTSPNSNQCIAIRSSKNFTLMNSYIHDSSGGSGTSAIYVGSNNLASKDSGGHLFVNNIISHGDQVDRESNNATSYESSDDRCYYGIEIENSPGIGGITIRNNEIFGFVDGLAPVPDEGLSPVLGPDDRDLLDTWLFRELDIYDNTIYDCSDDCIELDGIVVNARVFRNELGRCQNAISVAPMYPGPMFIVRNIAHGFNEGFLKQNTGVPGIMRNVFVYHNTVAMFKSDDSDFGKNLLNIAWPAHQMDFVYMNNIFYSHEAVYTGYMTDEEYGDMGQSYHMNNIFDYNVLYSTKEKSDDEPIIRWISRADDGLNMSEYDTLESFIEVVGQEVHGRVGDPLLKFTPLDKYPKYSMLLDLGIQDGSAAIDAGDVINGISNSILGEAPDCGAIEFK